MKVLYDGQIFDSQSIGGISRYFFELMARFEKDAELEFEVAVAYSNNPFLTSLPTLRQSFAPAPAYVDHYKNFFGGRNFRLKPKLFTLKTKFLPNPENLHAPSKNREKSIELLRQGAFDIFHPTYYNSYFLDFIGRKPYVVTVYDLIHEIFPELLSWDTDSDKNVQMLKGATHIIAISENTKRDLVSIFGIDETKVTVIHLGNSLQEPTGVATTFRNRLPANYLLYVGGRWGYKNFQFFARVMTAVFGDYNDLHVVCTGPSFKADETEFLDRLGFRNRFHHVLANDDELAWLYQNARAFIFPSLYEGFGLPVLEAFGLGCPVLASSTSSLPEVGGDAAVYFHPKDAASMSAAIRAVLEDDSLRQAKVQSGLERCRMFSWVNTAAQTKQLYTEVLKNYSPN